MLLIPVLGVRAQDSEKESIYFELPLISAPYIQDAMSTTGGFFQSYMNPDMDMSLKISDSFYTGSHYLLRSLFENERWARASIYIFDGLSNFLPLGNAWLHEEYHRAVMTKNGVNSFNEVLLFPIGSSVVAVSHEKDELLAAMCDGNRRDFIRLMSAGLEAQTMLVQQMQRKDFFGHRNLYNEFSYWMNVINNAAYLFQCATGSSDEQTAQMNASETTIEERDFTGMDLNAWVYELYNPDKKYADRGTHPSGVGIDRYISSDKLSDAAKRTLKVETALECLNVLNPMLFGMNRFYVGSTKSGEWYMNAAMRHFLTSFGNDVALEALVEAPSFNGYAMLHSYNNHSHHFAGLEAGIVDKRFLDDRVGVSANANVWIQPEGFEASAGKIGGAFGLKASVRTKYVEPYLEASVKSAGWLAGDVNLGSAASARFGIRMNLR